MKKLTKIITENYPLLWASQLIKMLVLFFITLVVEYIVVLFMPVSASDYLVLSFPLALFLGIIIYRTIQQNKYFDANFSFKQIYLLYILNVFIIILIGILIFCFGFFMQSKTKKLVKEDQFDHDITIMRVSYIGKEDIKMLRTILKYPDTRQTILKNQTNNGDMPLTNNKFITGYFKSNKPLYSFLFSDSNNEAEEKYYSYNDITEKIYDAETSPPDSFNLSMYDTAKFNVAALKLVTQLNEKGYDSLWSVALRLFEKYGISIIADFDKMDTAITQIDSNSRIIDYYIDPEENILFLFLLFVVIDMPIISIIAGLSKRYQLNFKTFSFPLSYFSFFVHVILTVTVFVLFFDLFGNTQYYALLSLILALFICVVIFKMMKLNVFLRSFFTQLLHYQLVYLLPIFFWLLEGKLFENTGAKEYILLYVSNFVFVILINFYFFKEYYKLSYLPLR